MSLETSSTRWRVKKLARAGVALASRASGSMAVRRWLRGAPCVRVITYHRFGELPGDPFCLDTEMFEAQMRCLAEDGRAISLDQLHAHLDGAATLPDDAVLVTIDDGFRSTLDLALPILRDLGVPAVAYVTAGLIGNERAAERMPERYLSWEEVAKLPEGGIEVGSHAFTHASLGLMPIDRATDEGARSRQRIEERCGATVRSFAYPFGTRVDFSDETGRALGSVGYTSVFTSQHGVVVPGMDPLELPRVKVESGESLAHFRALTHGAMDAWRIVDTVLARLQQDRVEQGVD